MQSSNPPFDIAFPTTSYFGIDLLNQGHAPLNQLLIAFKMH